MAGAFALLGAVAWLARVALVWNDPARETEGGILGACSVVGAICLALALLVGGYATVTSAPIWLRILVSVATLALGLVLFTALDDAARALHSGGNWLEDELGLLVAGVLMLLLGLVGLLRRTAPGTEHEPAGHHIAR